MYVELNILKMVLQNTLIHTYMVDFHFHSHGTVIHDYFAEVMAVVGSHARWIRLVAENSKITITVQSMIDRKLYTEGRQSTAIKRLGLGLG